MGKLNGVYLFGSSGFLVGEFVPLPLDRAKNDCYFCVNGNPESS
jgi:hypothetical protein